MSELVMAGTKNCRVCGHKLSLHSGVDPVQERAEKRAAQQATRAAAPVVRSGPAAGWYPVVGGTGRRWWDGAQWTVTEAEFEAQQIAEREAAELAAAAPIEAEVSSGLPPSGWLADPDDATMLRWWDGSAWGEFRKPVGS